MSFNHGHYSTSPVLFCALSTTHHDNCMDGMDTARNTRATTSKGTPSSDKSQSSANIQPWRRLRIGNGIDRVRSGEWSTQTFPLNFSHGPLLCFVHTVQIEFIRCEETGCFVVDRMLFYPFHVYQWHRLVRSRHYHKLHEPWARSACCRRRANSTIVS